MLNWPQSRKVEASVNYGNLTLGENGIWFSHSRSSISYPASGNDTCFEIEDHSFWFAHRNRCIVDCMRNFAPPGAVFDVGGGNGFVALELLRSGYDAILVEPGIHGAHNAQRRGLPNVICSTFEDADFRAHSLPAIGIFDVLEHVEGDRQFLSQLRKALQPDGRLYVTVPAYQALWSSDDDFAGHARRYTVSSLVRDLTEASFEVEYATYFFSILPIPILLTRSLPSLLGSRDPSSHSKGSANQHVSSQKLGRTLQAVLDWEQRRIAGGRSIPFGSSCLAVARPKSG